MFVSTMDNVIANHMLHSKNLFAKGEIVLDTIGLMWFAVSVML